MPIDSNFFAEKMLAWRQDLFFFAARRGGVAWRSGAVLQLVSHGGYLKRNGDDAS